MQNMQMIHTTQRTKEADNRGSATKNFIFALFIAIVVFGVIIAVVKFDVLGSLKTTGQQAKQAMGQKWEYKIDSFYDKDLKTEMNVQGEAGWELVFARRALNEDEAMYEMIFKRRK